MRINSMFFSPQQLRLAVESRASSNKWRTFIRRTRCGGPVSATEHKFARAPERQIYDEDRRRESSSLPRRSRSSVFPPTSPRWTYVLRVARFRSYHIGAYTRKIELTLLSHELFTIERQNAALSANFVEVLEISRVGKIDHDTIMNLLEIKEIKKKLFRRQKMHRPRSRRQCRRPTTDSYL